MNTLKTQMDRGDAPTNLRDPHVPASTLKLWFRELTDPIVPEDTYDDCIASSQDSVKAVAVVDMLPHINRSIVLFITRFLQVKASAKIPSYRLSPSHITLKSSIMPSLIIYLLSKVTCLNVNH